MRRQFQREKNQPDLNPPIRYNQTEWSIDKTVRFSFRPMHKRKKNVAFERVRLVQCNRLKLFNQF